MINTNNFRIILATMRYKYSDSYNKFLIAWDLLNGSYHEISAAIKKKKITNDDVNEVVESINELFNIFDKKLVFQLIER